MFRNRTSWAVVGSSVLNEPLLVLYSLLAFILHRNFGASVGQVALLFMVKPVASILSLHWSHWIGRWSLRRAVLVTGVLARLPFLFFPFVNSVWLMLLLAGLFMTLFRGAIPPFMEALKQSAGQKGGSRIFSRGLAIGYAEGVVLAFGMGVLLDGNPEAWRWMFPVAALFGMGATLFQALLNGRGQEREGGAWQGAWRLMREDRPFRLFQVVFFVAGFGLMLMFPVLPVYFDDVLGLSYTQLALALSVYKGIGFAASSGLWSRLLAAMPVFQFVSLVCALFGAFGIALLCAASVPVAVYVAYLIYGVAQGGSELVWHMCGPIFAPERDSTGYSSANVVMVGIRGLLAPPLGAVLLLVGAPGLALGCGCVLFLGASLLARRWSLLLPAKEPVR